MDIVVCEQPLKNIRERLKQLGFLNLFIVAVIGLMLRSYSFIELPFSYVNLLHGHSHFAFGGWLMPVMVWMIMQYFPSIASKVAFNHWKNISAIILLSAYGMLLSFPFQGYGVISILFSTLAVAAGFYLAIVLFKATREYKRKTSVMFLRWALVYLVLSAIGPFATA